MLASLDRQRNRRGMIQAFVSHADGGHLPLRWTSSSRHEGDYVYTQNLRYDPRLGRAPESGPAMTSIGGAEQ